MPTIKCLAIFFFKIFKFLRILYSFYKILAILKVKLWNLGEPFLEKMKINELFLGKTTKN
jgi:hypothetical protein